MTILAAAMFGIACIRRFFLLLELGLKRNTVDGTVLTVSLVMVLLGIAALGISVVRANVLVNTHGWANLAAAADYLTSKNALT